MQVIHLADFFLMPLYCVAVLVLVFLFRKKANPDPSTYRIYYTSISLKILGGLASALVFQYYYGTGDSMIYFDEARLLHNHIVRDPSNIRYLFNNASSLQELYDPSANFVISNFYNSNTVATIRFVTFVTFLSANKYLTTTLLFSLFSFTGAWAIYRVFIDRYPSQKKMLAIGMLYLPSLIFWCSSVSKDTICFAALGWSFYCMHKIFTAGKHHLRYGIVLLLAMYITWLVKSYIVMAVLISLLLAGVFYLFFNIRPLMKRIIVVSIFLGFLIYFFNTKNLITDAMDKYTAGFIVDKIYEMQHNYETTDSGANFDVGVIEPTVSGILSKVPGAISIVLFRPFLWESKNALALLSGLENFLLLVFSAFVILRTGPINFFKVLHDDGLVLFCFMFSMVLASVIGLTTFNFGTIIRYKTAFIAFYTAFLILMNYRAGLLREKKRSVG